MTSLILSAPQIIELKQTGQCVTVKVVKCGGEPLEESLFQWNPRHGSPDFPFDKSWWSAGNGYAFKQPHQPGETRWVKEVWATSWCCDDRPSHDMEKPGRGYGWPVWYSADLTLNTRSRAALSGGIGFTTRGKQRTPATMPKWASRFTLTCTAVNCEQRDGKWCWITTWKLNTK